MALSRLWVAMLTRYTISPGSESLDPGTDSPIRLSINTDGIDRLNHTFHDSVQVDQDEGVANLYEIDVEGRGIEVASLTNSSIRLHILGDDQWMPLHFFIWGESFPRTPNNPRLVTPIAIEMGMTTKLSTNDSGAVRDMSLRLVQKGSSTMQINRLLILVKTAGFIPNDPFIGGGVIVNDSSKGNLETQIVSDDRLNVLFEIRDTHQCGMLGGQVSFYTAPVIFPFTKNSLNNQSITLRLRGMDNWRPESVFLFGLNDASGRPESIVPLVHLPEWPYGMMEPDPTNGTASITLPIARDSNVQADLEDIGIAFKIFESTQNRTNELLEQLIAKLK